MPFWRASPTTSPIMQPARSVTCRPTSPWRCARRASPPRRWICSIRRLIPRWSPNIRPCAVRWQHCMSPHCGYCRPTVCRQPTCRPWSFMRRRRRGISKGIACIRAWSSLRVMARCLIRGGYRSGYCLSKILMNRQFKQLGGWFGNLLAFGM